LTILASPFRLFTSRSSLRDPLTAYLAPGLSFQLNRIYAQTSEISSTNIAFLILVTLLSPFLALGLALWAWIVALYWVLAAIVGNPDGLDGRNDGRELVLSTRRWWLSWLKLALKDD